MACFVPICDFFGDVGSLCTAPRVVACCARLELSESKAARFEALVTGAMLDWVGDLGSSSDVTAVVPLGVRGVSRRCSVAVLKAVLSVAAVGGGCRKSAMPAELSRSLHAKLHTLPESLRERLRGK
jgi:hypothetical protein